MRAFHGRGSIVYSAAFLVLPCVLVLLAARTEAQPACTAAPLSQQQVAALIAKARQEPGQLPTPFAEVETVFRKEGCHYVYIEYALPRTPDKQNIFRVNQHGVIVDVEPGAVTCPDNELSESRLGEILNAARASRKDLPAAFPNTRVRVDRRRCLYVYFEYAVPEKPGNFQVFTIDQFGEVLDYYRNKAH